MSAHALRTTPPVQHADEPDSLAFRGPNRRGHHRFPLIRASKVYRPSSSTFVPARTVNLSIGGALVEAASTRPFEVGEVVEIGVALRGAALVREPAMVEAVVVRVSPAQGDRQAVALRYLNPHHPAPQAA